jgi:hypothetical protein
MRIRPAPWLIVLALAFPAWAQTPTEEAAQPASSPAPETATAPADAAAPVPEPDRFLPTDKIPPDSVISFPADI